MRRFQVGRVGNKRLPGRKTTGLQSEVVELTKRCHNCLVSTSGGELLACHRQSDFTRPHSLVPASPDHALEHSSKKGKFSFEARMQAVAVAAN